MPLNLKNLFEVELQIATLQINIQQTDIFFIFT